MITRTFLFLLAMVTGFSAANAEQTARPALAEIGASASVSSTYSNAVEQCDRLLAATCVLLQHPAKLAVTAYSSVLILSNQALPAPRTHRADRARE